MNIGVVSVAVKKRNPHQRFAMFGKDCLQHRMIGDADADGFALIVLHAARHFAAGRQNAGVGTGEQRFQQAELHVIHARIAGKVGQVGADNGEGVVAFQLTDMADFFRSGLVVELAEQRIAGIARRDDHAAVA